MYCGRISRLHKFASQVKQSLLKLKECKRSLREVWAMMLAGHWMLIYLAVLSRLPSNLPQKEPWKLSQRTITTELFAADFQKFLLAINNKWSLIKLSYIYVIALKNKINNVLPKLPLVKTNNNCISSVHVAVEDKTRTRRIIEQPLLSSIIICSKPNKYGHELPN